MTWTCRHGISSIVIFFLCEIRSVNGTQFFLNKRNWYEGDKVKKDFLIIWYVFSISAYAPKRE